MGHVTITTPLSRTVCRQWNGTSYDQPTCQIQNLYIHPLQSMKSDKNAKIRVVCGLGVTQGHRQHNCLIKCI